MELPYIIKVQLCIALLWGVYKLFLQNSGEFGHNRAYLLGMIAASFLIPALSIPVYESQAVPVTFTTIPQGMMVSEVTTAEVDTITWETIFFYIYLTGIAIMGIGLAWQSIRLWHSVRGAIRTRVEDTQVIYSNRIHSAFSFFGYIFINGEKIGTGEMPQVVAHEMCHVRLRHSIDALFAQVLLIALWWNPFIWLWNRSLKEVHEYQADEAVLNLGFDSKQYITLIISNLTDIHPEFVSGFSYSLIKKRLLMIGKIHSKHTRFRMLLAIPATALLLVLFSFTEKPAKADMSRLFTGLVSENTTSSDSDSVSFVVNGGKVESIEGLKADSIRSIDVTKKDGYTVVNVIMKSSTSLPDSIRYYINGKQVFNIDGLQPDDIESIHVLKSVFPHQIRVTTKSGKADPNRNSIRISRGMTTGDTSAVPNAIRRGISIRGRAAIENAGEHKDPEEGKNPTEINEVTVIGYGRPSETRTGTSIRSSRGSSQTHNSISILNGYITILKDGQPISEEEMNKIDPKTIKSINIEKTDDTNRVIILTKEKGAVIEAEGKAIRIKQVEDDDEPFVAVERMPIFQGGNIQTFKTWVMNQIKYPVEAQKKKIEGRVLVRFVVNSNGKVSSIKVVESPNRLLSEEVVSIVESSPDWTPGMQRGKNVNVAFHLPIDFKLQ